jgi:hypothetical protein
VAESNAGGATERALVEIERVVDIRPGAERVALDRADTIQILRCESEGDTVPFHFNPRTGTLDLPAKYMRRGVRVTYTDSQSAYREEVYREIREEEQQRRGLPPLPCDQLAIIDRLERGPYRSSAIMVRTKADLAKPLTWWQKLNGLLKRFTLWLFRKERSGAA